MNRYVDLAFDQQETHLFLTEPRLLTVAAIQPRGEVRVRRVRYAAVDKRLAFLALPDAIVDGCQVSVFAESGDTWSELRGVEIQGNLEIITDEDAVTRIAEAVYDRYEGGVGSGQFSGAPAGRVGVGVQFGSSQSWDHRKRDEDLDGSSSAWDLNG